MEPFDKEIEEERKTRMPVIEEGKAPSEEEIKAINTLK